MSTRIQHLSGRPGFLLVESLVAIALVSTLAIALLKATETGYLAKRAYDVRATADVVARNQMESVLAQPYQAPGGSYQVASTPAGFSVAVAALTYDATTTTEIVRVTVSHLGTTVRTVQTIRTQR